MKKILIINGSGGVGKDTFVELLSKYVPTLVHISVVDPVKKIAKYIGWNGSKDEPSRKFLAELKFTIDGYNDYTYEYFENQAIDFLHYPMDEPALLCGRFGESRRRPALVDPPRNHRERHFPRRSSELLHRPY